MYAYLDRPVRDLAETDLFLVSAMRGWVAAARSGRCACGALRRGFEARAVADALTNFATAMALVDRHGIGMFRLAPVAGCCVTDDEARLLSLFALARGGDSASLGRAATVIVQKPAVPHLIHAVNFVGAALMGDAA